MKNLCEEIEKELKPLGNDRLEIEYMYDEDVESYCVNVYIENQRGQFWNFLIEKQIREKNFEISFSPHTNINTNKKIIEENKKEIIFYYDAFMNAFEKWIAKQGEIRLQYMLNRDEVVDESAMISYIKMLKKEEWGIEEGWFQTLAQELQKQYESVLTTETPFEISQMNNPKYGKIRWELHVKIRFAEEKRFFITMSKERDEETLRVYIRVLEKFENGLEYALGEEEFVKEKERLSMYYEPFKEIVLKWIQSIPSLRLRYVLSRESVIKESELIIQLMS